MDERRPRWALAIGAVLLAGLVIALVWLALRGDPGDTVVSTPETSDAAAAPTIPDVTEPAATATTVARRADGTSTTSVALGAVELGFDPVCTDRDGAEPEQPATWDDTFGPLGAEPVLTVTFPESVDVTADPQRAPSVASAVLRPEGLFVAVVPADGHGFDETVLARVGLDGSVVWTRCLGERVVLGSAPEAGVNLAVRPVTEADEADGWTTLSSADGSTGAPLDAEQNDALETAGSSSNGDSAADGDGPTLGFAYDSERGRSVVAGLDDGRVLWSAPEVVLPDGGFRAEAVGDIALIQSCDQGDAEVEDTAGTVADEDVADTAGCPTGELRGHDLATGALLWSRDGVHDVVASDGGVDLALVGDGTVWVLLDTRSGRVVDGQRWDDPATFDVDPSGPDPSDPDAEPASGRVLRDGGALVVVRPGSVAVWLPVDNSTEDAIVSIP